MAIIIEMSGMIQLVQVLTLRSNVLRSLLLMIIVALWSRLCLDCFPKMRKVSLRRLRFFSSEKIAVEINDQKMLDAVDIIERAHRPSVSATYIIAEKKNENGKWVKIPLSATSDL